MSRFADAIIRFVTNAREAGTDISKTRQELVETGKAAKQSAADVIGTVTGIAGQMALAAGAGLAAGAAVSRLYDNFKNRKSDAQDAMDALVSSIRTTRDEIANLSAGKSAPEAAKEAVSIIARANRSVVDDTKKTTDAIGSEWASGSREAGRLIGGAMRDFNAALGYEGEDALAETLADSVDESGLIGNLESAARQLSAVAAREAKRARDSRSQADVTAYMGTVAEQWKADKQRIDALTREAEDAEMKRLEGVERIRAEEARALDDIANRREKAGTDEERAALDRLAAATKASADAEVKKTQKAKEEAEQRAKDQVAAAVANQRALEDSYRKIVENFNKEITAGMSRLSEAQRNASAAQLSGITTEITRIGDLISSRLRSVGNGV